MANHAGGRLSVVNLGTKFWRPPVQVTQFLAPEEWFWGRLFVRQKSLFVLGIIDFFFGIQHLCHLQAVISSKIILIEYG